MRRGRQVEALSCREARTSFGRSYRWAERKFMYGLAPNFFLLFGWDEEFTADAQFSALQYSADYACAGKPDAVGSSHGVSIKVCLPRNLALKPKIHAAFSCAKSSGSLAFTIRARECFKTVEKPDDCSGAGECKDEIARKAFAFREFRMLQLPVHGHKDLSSAY